MLKANAMHAYEDVPKVLPLPDHGLAAAVQQAIDAKTKPLGALGRLEALMLQVARVQGTAQPRWLAPQLLVCAADHGLAAQGVSAYPAEVTPQMVLNMLAGGAAVSVLARQHGLAFTVADCGVRGALPEQPGLRRLWVEGLAHGTADSSQGPAMSSAQCAQAMRQGAQLVASLPGNALLLGEMGIGNTSAASLLMARLTGLPLTDCVGRGTGLDDAQLARKHAVLARALAANPTDSPMQALAALGGLEIATLTGAVLQAAAERRVVVVDGFITTAAVAVAAVWAPAVLERCVFAHASAESGHARWLALLGAKPLLDLGLRLGEGSGAALAWPLLVSAVNLLNDMASFASAGVSQREP
jgi:nicotinate-nucleotide--dimethylbenzimidazole phosphoribosyltransferase